MYHDNNNEIFLNKLEDYMKMSSKLRKSSINVYLRKIRNLLETGYTVADLCGGVDQLIEDYSRNGIKFDDNDHGNTKAALNWVRDMIKGDIISSLYVSYNRGGSVWSRKDKHITEYYIKGDKIVLSFNTCTRKISRKVGAVDVGKLINILQDAESQGFFDNDFTLFQGKMPLTDAPSPGEYEYYIGKSKGNCRGSIFGEGDEPQRIALRNQYDTLIAKLICPYTL